MWRRRHRKPFCVHQPAQHFKTRVSVSDFAGEQQRRVGRTTNAQQRKVVRRPRPHSPPTATGVRPPLNLDKNAVVYVVPHEKTTPGVAAATGNGETVRRRDVTEPPPRRGKTHMFDGSRPLWGNSRIFKRRVGVGMSKHRSHQPPEPRTITRHELQAEIHNYVFAHRVRETRRPYRVNQALTIGVFHVNAAMDDFSCRTVHQPNSSRII